MPRNFIGKQTQKPRKLTQIQNYKSHGTSMHETGVLSSEFTTNKKLPSFITP